MLSVALLIALSTAVASCGTTSSVGAAESAKTKAAKTTTGLKKARWAKRIKVAYRRKTVRMRASGIPNHSRPEYYAVPTAGTVVPDAGTSVATPDPTSAQNYDLTLPLRPRRASQVTEAPLGSIGLMISGAVLFNPYEGDGTTVAMQNDFSIPAPGGASAPFVDDCSGHPAPGRNGGGQYHYHALPACVASQANRAGRPSRIIGIAFDGYPIYGNRDIDGKKISVANLDRCNGIKSPTPEFPRGIYHYVLPGTTDATSSIRCFRGIVDPDLIQQMPPMGGGPPGGGPPAPPAALGGSLRALLCALPDALR